VADPLAGENAVRQGGGDVASRNAAGNVLVRNRRRAVQRADVVVGAVAVCRLHSARITDPKFFAICEAGAGWYRGRGHTSEARPSLPLSVTRNMANREEAVLDTSEQSGGRRQGSTGRAEGIAINSAALVR